MTDLAAISHRVTQAIADAERHGALEAAEVLRVDVVELLRLARGHHEDHAEPAPSESPSTAPTEAIVRHDREHG